MAKSVYAIEGLDRLGKSTLIEGLKQREGFYQVVHFGKPEILQAYENAKDEFAWYQAITPPNALKQRIYQEESFRNSMIMAQSGARIIFDRWHLGEFVYGPMYRRYTADYVFDMERNFELQHRGDIRLILLIEDFDRSCHFQSDGDSFDDNKRRDEQELFVQAFQRSIIPDKRMICVTDLNGQFRKREAILNDAIFEGVK